MPPDDRKPRQPLHPTGRPDQRRGAGNAGQWGEENLGEVYFEFKPIGNYMRVNAIHGATGREIFVLGPLNANRGDLQMLALRKLRTSLNSKS